MPLNNCLGRTLVLFASVGTAPAMAYADDVYFGPGHYDHLVVTFEAPVQPSSYNAIQISPTSGALFSGSLIAEVSLFDEAGLLGRGMALDGLYAFFTDPTSYFSGREGSVDIDFSRIADGVYAGRFELRFAGGTEGAYVRFDPTTYWANTFGDSGSFPVGQPTVTGVSWSVSAVPEPATWMMLALGAGFVGFSAKRRIPTVRSSHPMPHRLARS